MTFQDIFSKTPTKIEIKCPNPKIPIIIDTREKQSLIATNLINQKTNIEFEKLDIGDYLIQDTIIERKTFPDFISSMISKRLQVQLINLKKYPKPLLLIEGNSQDHSKISPNAIRGMLLSIATDFQVPTIFTKDEEDTATNLILLAKKAEKSPQEYSLRPSPNARTFTEQKQFILEGFPGIGPTLSKKLLEEYTPLQKIFNTSKENLQKIKGFDEKKLNTFLKLLRA